MTTLYLATDNGPIVVTAGGEHWYATRPLEVRSVLSAQALFPCIATDPSRPERAFWGTWSDGVWRSDDAGKNWQRVFAGIPHERITSLRVGRPDHPGDDGIVYVGTEPSAVFRSENGGQTWRECVGLTDLPSSSEWSFPPRPETNHVRWIEPDPYAPGRLFVAIEAGALVSTDDGGRTWRDRVPGGPYDTHQLATHTNAPGRLWSAAGDGFFESDDAGETWRQSEDGLRFRYCYSIALDSHNPEIAVVTAAPGPWQAYNSEQAESGVFRRVGNTPWQEIRGGLPASKGTRVPVVATHPAEPGVFYCAAEATLYRSSDGGLRWERLDVELPLEKGESRVHALVAVETE